MLNRKYLKRRFKQLFFFLLFQRSVYYNHVLQVCFFLKQKPEKYFTTSCKVFGKLDDKRDC